MTGLEILITVGLILLSLCILVTIHELGHFWAAKLFKIRVETFSIFFPPKIFGFKRGDTTYQIGSIPLGGYVKITGMIDESMDKEHLDKPIEDWEFRAKPVWQRFIVMIAGIVMNVILALFIFTIITFIEGDENVPMSELDRFGMYVPEGSAGERLGMKTGDKLVSMNGTRPDYVNQAAGFSIMIEDNAFYEVERNGQTLKLPVPNNLLDSIKCFQQSYPFVFGMNIPSEINVEEGEDTPAENSGLKDGDIIKRINGAEVVGFEHMAGLIRRLPLNTVATVEALRGTELDTFAVAIGETARFGIRPNSIGKTDTISYSLGGAFMEGARMSFGVIGTQIKGYGKIASGKASATKNMQGPIGIAVSLYNAFKVGGWSSFWKFTAMISMILAFINLLPIPALDGGHLVFLTFEAITGKNPSDKVKIIAQYVGMVILLALMIFIFGNDIFQAIMGSSATC